MADKFVPLFEKNITKKDIQDAAKDPLAFVSIPQQFDFKIGFTVGEKDYKSQGTILVEKKRVEAIFNKYHAQLLKILVFIFQEGNELSLKPNLKLDETIKTIKNAADAQYKQIHDSCIKEIETLFAEIKEKNQEYRAVQIKAALEFTLSGVSLATGIAGLASSPFTLGFSMAFSIMSLVKTAASMGQQIYDTLQSAEKSILKLDKSLEKVKNRFAADAQAEAIKAVASQTISQFLGKDLFTTLVSCQKDFKKVTHKVHGSYKALVEIGEKLAEATDKHGKLAELMKDKNNKGLSDEKLLKMMVAVATLTQQIRNWTFKLKADADKYEAMDKRMDELEKDMELLVDKNTKLLTFQGRFQTFLDWSSILTATADSKTLVEAGSKAVGAFKDLVQDKAQQKIVDEASNLAAATEINTKGWFKFK